MTLEPPNDPDAASRERRRNLKYWETRAKGQIDSAAERGEFQDLPGAGKPLPGIDKPYDELWWVKNLVQREKADVLPESLRIKREVEETLMALDRLSTESEVRAVLESLNEKIRRVNATNISGPPTTVTPILIETCIESWREGKKRARHSS